MATFKLPSDLIKGLFKVEFGSFGDILINTTEKVPFTTLRKEFPTSGFEIGVKSISVKLDGAFFNLEVNKPTTITLPNKNGKDGQGKKSGCFVLTACYESYDAPTVFAFRQFRDNHLNQSQLGRGFIDWYYTHGPKMAEFISDKPRAKALLRSVFNRLVKMLPR